MTATYRAVAPLLHFEAEGERTAIADGVAVRRMTSDERARWESRILPLLHGPLEVDEESKGGPWNVLEMELPTESKELGIPIFGKLFRVVTTLRLFDTGDVGAPLMDYDLETERGRISGSTILSEELGVRKGGHHPFHLRLDNVDPLRSFLRDVEERLPLEDSTAYPGLAFALRRFNYAYGRSRAEDRLVDTVIGLEALLLSKRDGAKGQPLAKRASILLGETDVKRQEVRRFMEAAYGARNDVVHGGKPITEALAKRSDLAPYRFVKMLERHLAATIKKVVGLPEGMTREDFLRKLDDQDP